MRSLGGTDRVHDTRQTAAGRAEIARPDVTPVGMYRA